MRPSLKWPLIIIGIIAFLIVGGYALQEFAENKIRTAINRQTPAGDTLQTANVSFDLLTATVHIDSLYINQQIRQKNQQHFRLQGQIDHLVAKGISYWQYLTNKAYEADQLRVESPHLQVFSLEPTDTVATDSSQSKGLQLRLRNIDINDGNFSWRDGEEGSLTFATDSVNVDVRHLQLPHADSSTLPVEQVNWYVHEAHFPGGDSLYDYYFDRFTASTADSLVTLGSFRRTPRYNTDNFSKAVQYKTVWLALRLDSLRLAGLPLSNVLLQRRIAAPSLQIGDYSIEVYENQQLPENPNRSVKLFPQEALRKIKFPVTVEHLHAPHGRIVYRLRTAKGEEGDLAFDRGNLSIKNITNVPERIRNHSQMEVDYQCTFSDKAPLEAEFDFRLDDQSNAFTMSGRLGRYPLTDVNPMLEPAANVSIEAGNLHKLTYYASGNKHLVEGEMHLEYDSLEVELEEGFNFIQSMLKGLVLKKKNLPGKDFREGIIYQEHDLTRSFFNLYWRALVSGLKSSALSGIALGKELKRERKERRKAEREERRHLKKKKR